MKVWKSKLHPKCRGQRHGHSVATEVQHVAGQMDLTGIACKRVFLTGAAGGLGFQSVALTSPSAQAASWHACLPHALQRLGLQGTSALTSVSPWAQRCLPQATQVLRTALRDDTAFVGDEAVAASQHIGIRPSCCGRFARLRRGRRGSTHRRCHEECRWTWCQWLVAGAIGTEPQHDKCQVHYSSAHSHAYGSAPVQRPVPAQASRWQHLWRCA